MRLTRPDFDGGIFSPPRIVPDYAEGSLESTIVAPGVATLKSPLSTFYTWPTPTDSNAALGITGFDTEAEIPKSIFSSMMQANSLQPVENPVVNTKGTALAGIFSGAAQAASTQQATKPEPDTQAAALASIYSATTQASSLQQMVGPAIDTQAIPVDLAETGTIRGRIKLQGRTSSLGSYVEIGGQVTFADRQGYFEIQRTAGNFDLTARAPGYLSHEVIGISIEPGETVMVPVVTLPFGDADGDGVIDIYDLTVAARNYGRTATAVWFR